VNRRLTTISGKVTTTIPAAHVLSSFVRLPAGPWLWKYRSAPPGPQSSRSCSSLIINGKAAVLVMAAGNDGAAQPAYPGRFASSYGIADGIAVGAVSSAGSMASWSTRAGSTPLTDVSAPGVNIHSAFNDNSYKVWSGTSMAAPQVAGLAALLLGFDPTLTNTAVERLFSASASDGGLPARSLADNRDPITGW